MKILKNNFITPIFYSLEIITILTLGTMILSPLTVKAESDGENVVFVNRYVAPAEPVAAAARNPVPTINSITPTSVAINSGSSTMTVTGTNFVQSSVVRIDGSDRATTYVSSTKLTAELNYADTTALGTHTVHVYNPGPGGGLSNKTYLNIKPAGSVAGASTKKVTASKASVKNPYAFQPASESDFQSEYDYNALTGNALFGANGFLPTGILQWILFAILILLIVIIARKVFKKEDHSPLKHA